MRWAPEGGRVPYACDGDVRRLVRGVETGLVRVEGLRRGSPRLHKADDDLLAVLPHVADVLRHEAYLARERAHFCFVLVEGAEERVEVRLAEALEANLELTAHAPPLVRERVHLGAERLAGDPPGAGSHLPTARRHFADVRHDVRILEMSERAPHEHTRVLLRGELGLARLHPIPVLLELLLGLTEHEREAGRCVRIVHASPCVLEDDRREPMVERQVVGIGFNSSSISALVTESSFFSKPRNTAAARRQFIRTGPSSSRRARGARRWEPCSG